MGAVSYDIRPEAERSTEIVVHIDETLGSGQRSNLVQALEGTEGIRSAEFCPLRYHLMLVNYNRERITSQDVLSRVTSQNVHAELIGPV
jgi:hypothetical protein